MNKIKCQCGNRHCKRTIHITNIDGSSTYISIRTKDIVVSVDLDEESLGRFILALQKQLSNLG
jgi:hypothetical protein